jgi:predicted nucleotidyltransferase
VSRRPGSAFDPLRALRVLNDRKVRFVLIGGFAGRLYGSPTVTNDLDLCYARDPENLERIAGALRELRAHLREAPERLPFRLDAKTLGAGLNFTFETDAGNLDVLGMPSGTHGFEELDRTAEALDLDGLTVRVASLDDLIRMKQAAARPKDLIEVEVLGALRDEIESGGWRASEP